MGNRRQRLFLLVTAFAIASIVLALLTWLSRDRIQPTLDAARIPTAEYLMQHISPLPVFIGSINPNPGSLIVSDQEICIAVMDSALRPPNDTRSQEDFLVSILWNTSIFINGVRAPRSAEWGNYYAGAYVLSDGSTSGADMFCLALKLLPGLHIIEIQITDHGQTYSYTWAYQVK